MELKDKRFLVLGLARTGRECARFLAGKGARVTVSDRRPAAELKGDIENLADLSIEYRLGGEDPNWLAGVDGVIPSPGVAMENGLLREASARGIPILSEIELAYRFFGAPLAAVTTMRWDWSSPIPSGASPRWTIAPRW